MIRKRASFVMVWAVLAALSVTPWNTLAKGKKDFTLHSKARINQVVLEPGHYKVEVLSDGESNVDVAIYQGRKLLVKAPAKKTDSGAKASRNTVRLNVGSDVPSIVEMELAGETVIYQFESGSDQAQKK